MSEIPSQTDDRPAGEADLWEREAVGRVVRPIVDDNEHRALTWRVKRCAESRKQQSDDLPVVVDRHQDDERHRRTSTVNSAAFGNQATPSCRAETSTR